jgi:hypothetical protein
MRSSWIFSATWLNNAVVLLQERGSSVAEPHYVYAAPAPGKNFDAAQASALTLPCSRQTFFLTKKLTYRIGLFSNGFL